MPAPCSRELRERVVTTYITAKGAESYESVAERFKVGVASVSRWLRLHRETGSVAPKPMGGDRRSAPIAEEATAMLDVMIRDDPTWTTSELSVELGHALGIELSRTTVGRMLYILGFSYKRGVSRPPAAWRPEVITRRETFIAQQGDMDVEKLVFLDESGFIVGMNRLYGWAPVGEQAIISAETKGERLSVVGAMSVNGSRGMMSFSGTLNTDVMVTYVNNVLGPNLLPGDIVVLDGLSVHRSDQVRQAIESFGAKILVLPPYSPELNPIEHLWSTLKARVRAMGPVTWKRLEELVGQVWLGLNAEFFPNWVKACGYAVH